MVEAVHGGLVAHEAARVGGEGPEHDGHTALVHGADPLSLHEVLEHISNAVVLAFRR